MKKTFHFFSALALGLSLGLASCSDNDLDNGGSNGGSSEQNDALAQKYEALQTLLGSLASVDSLPSNWNSSTYTEVPTVGTVKDEAQPHVRYVVTTSQAEADRLYRSYLSKDVTGTPSDDSWQMDGIGSMQFHLENDPNLFATLDVNVQQLPTLEQVRFVSQEAMGNNGVFAPSGTYYGFGDVVLQQIPGVEEPTLWVCVRPCSTSPNRRQSHWCTFQLVPAGDKDKQNFLDLDGTNILPTHLAGNKSDAERMVQNYFNVLRLMANPKVAQHKDYAGIDVIAKTNTQASYSTLSNTSFLWDYFDLWNDKAIANSTDLSGSLVNSQYSLGDPFRTIVENAAGNVVINAFYNGYSTNYFSTGDYTVYNLQIGATEEEAPFNIVRKQTAYVKKSEGFDFTKYQRGVSAGEDNVHFNSTYLDTYQFIVKYCTGGELEGKSHSTNDLDPAKSFSARSNGIYDVLVARNYANTESYGTYTEGGKEKTAQPFFCIGDRVYKTLYDEENSRYGGFKFCVRNASDVYVNQQDWKTSACFVGYDGDADSDFEDKSGIEDKTKVVPTQQDIAAALYQILQSKLYSGLQESEVFTEEHNIYQLYKNNEKEYPYIGALEKLYGALSTDFASSLEVEENENQRTASTTILVGNTYYTIKLTRTGRASQAQDTYTVTKHANYDGDLNELFFFTYNDKYAFREEYSADRTLIATKGTERSSLKTQLAIKVQQFMSNVHYEGF